MVFGFFPAKTLQVAAELALADHLADGPRTTVQLAEASASHAPTLHRLLRALALLGVVEEREAGVFGLTELGQSLRSDVPHSLRALCQLFPSDTSWRAWGELLASVRTGETGWDRVFDESAFEYMAARPEMATMFNRAMSDGTRAIAPALPPAYDFGRFQRLVDVGGGDGTLLAAILNATPGLSGTVYDLPAGLAEAPARLGEAGVADRVELVEGDFFDSVPPSDGYVLKSVLHDWDDERSVAILSSCRQAIAADGRMLVVEGVLPARVGPDPALFGLVMSDLNMLACTGGRERTEDDFRSLFEAAGFTLSSVSAPLPATTYRVLEGTPASRPDS